jgi:hypothetical protein
MIKMLLSWLVVWTLPIMTILIPQPEITQPTPAVSILSPGEGSVVTSPIHLSVEIQPGTDTYLRIALINGSNITIARQLEFIPLNPEESTTLDILIPYEIPTESSEALLSVTTLDSFNRPQSLRAVRLTLSPNSTDKITTPDQPESQWLTIKSPTAGATISGGKFQITGTVTPVTDNPIFFELITETGGVIGNAFLSVSNPGNPFDFDLSINYNYLSMPRDVRLIVRQTAGKYVNTVILDSLLLTLEP